MDVKRLRVVDAAGAGQQIEALLGESTDCAEFTLKGNYYQPILQSGRDIPRVTLGFEPWIQFAPGKWQDMIKGTFNEMVNLWNDHRDKNPSVAIPKVDPKQLRAFIETHHLKALREYERSQIPWEELKVGTIVATTKVGFNGYSGAIRKIDALEKDSVNRNYALLANVEDENVFHDRSVLYEHVTYTGPFWWQSVIIIDYAHYKALNEREKRNHLNWLAGFTIKE
jgi:hypothetical protein